MTDLPKVMGPYKIEQELGEGGFSVVYLARANTPGSDELVALKVLNRPAVRKENLVKRFRQEAKTARQLTHNHIIRIFGTDDNGTPPFICMEYIAGGALNSKLDQNKNGLPLAEAIHIIQCVGQALTYAHQNNVIHRDVKPANILLDTTQNPARPVLTDFGLVKLLEEKDSQSVIPSATLMGTYHYMAPEQWNQFPPVTPATDVYALAITFFEMLSGRCPFEAESLFNLRDKHCNEPLPHLSNLAPQVGPFFDNLLIKAAAKDPAERYQTVTDFLNAVKLAYQRAQNYQILEKMWTGKFTTVYKAQHVSSGRLVALKVLTSNEDRQQTKRFEQEARVIARLKHPNVINIVEVVETGKQDQAFFITMEYIPGGALHDRLKKGPLNRAEAIHIVKSVGAALTLAHEHQVIHRDLKPENILLDDSQEPIRPVLTDFGLVKVLSIENLNTQIVTNDRIVLGTAYYTAPEQWEEKKPTPATDVYALAIIFFEMLSEQRPFEAKSPFMLMDKHLAEPAPILSTVAPEIGPFFDLVLLKAMEKNPCLRYQSITDFVAALEIANEQAEQDLLQKNREKAEQLIETVQNYVRIGRNLEAALTVIQEALDLCPTHEGALRLKGIVHFRQKNIPEALKSYRQTYQQQSELSPQIQQEYLEVLIEAAKLAEKNLQEPEAVEYYTEIWHILDQVQENSPVIQNLRKRTQEWLTQYHYRLVEEAYTQGQPPDPVKAIETIKEEIKALKTLQASSAIINDAGLKLHELQVKYYKDIIQLEEKKLQEKILTMDISGCLDDETVFNHYNRLDEACRHLIKIELEDRELPEKHRHLVSEQVKCHYRFAVKAEKKERPDYKSALRHYEAIHQLQQHYSYHLTELDFNLEEKTKELKKRVEDDAGYDKIRELVGQGKQAEALAALEQIFIKPGNYEHRDVAQMLWELVYAKHHDGQFPWGEEGISGLEVLSKRLMESQQARLERIKNLLNPWINFSEMIKEQFEQLRACEEAFDEIETRLNRAEVLAGVLHASGLEEKLTGLKQTLELWRDQLQAVEAGVTPSLIEEDWWQTIEAIEGTMEPGYTLPGERLKVFRQNDPSLAAIEENPAFINLQTLAQTCVEVKQRLDQVKAQVMTRLVAQKEEILNEAQSQLKSLKNRHKMSVFFIPVSLFVAVVVGKSYTLPIENLPPFILFIATLILILAIGYYIWLLGITIFKS